MNDDPASLKTVLFRLVAERQMTAEQALAVIARTRRSGAVEAAPQAAGDIAVIGMAGRFGRAADLDALWSLLVAGEDTLADAPPGHWDRAPERPVRCGFLRDADHFDPLFFKISPSEAALMDPQQRVFLEQAWAALEDAGLSDRRLGDAACGVFVGAGGGDYGHRLRDLGLAGEPFALLGNVASILASRIAYFLDLKGPSVAVDTACSSSLVAVHLACESLRAGTCALALAGGVCVINTPQFIESLERAGMLSPTGRCHTFDAAADGFVCGEGAGVVVLKPLAAALADGDRIHGVIRGSGINQDGRTNGITAPSGPSQTALLAGVYARIGVDPASITCVEAHGTGTQLGDPIEFEALTAAFRRFTDRRDYCALGSIKTNVGHTLTAAGIAGLLKVLLCLRGRVLPPSLHFVRQNPHITLAGSPFFVPTRALAWASDGPRRAAVSSFGFSGTNAHVVVEEAPAAPERAPARRSHHVFPISARTDPTLTRRIADLERWLGDQGAGVDLADLSYTLGARRSHFARRVAVVAADIGELRARLAALHARGPAAVGPTGDHADEPRRPAMRALLARLVEEPPSDDPRAESARLLALTELYVEGHEVDWSRLWAGARGRVVSLPPAPLARLRCAPRAEDADASATEQGSGAGADPPATGDEERAARPPASGVDDVPAEALLAAVSAALAAPATDDELVAQGGAFAALEQHGRARLHRALARLGLFAGPQRVFTRTGLAQRLGVVPRAARMFWALLGVLERGGAVRREGDLIRVLAAPGAQAVAGDVDRDVDAAGRAFTGTPLAPFAEFLARCVDACPEVLRGSVSAVEVLFPGGSTALVERIYQGNRLAEHYNEMLAGSVQAAVRALLERRGDRGRPVRILEIGAGTGGATAGILAGLAAFAGRVEYVYTDVSLGFVQLGRERFAAAYPFVRFAALDVAGGLEEQGFRAGEVDVAIASNVVHAMPRIADALAWVRRVVRPGGLFVLNEVTAVQDFATLTFGLTDGWWAFEDAEARLSDSPLLDVAGWTRALDAAGFPHVGAFGLPGQTDPGEFPQAVLVAGRDMIASPARLDVASAVVAGGGRPRRSRGDASPADRPRVAAVEAILVRELAATLTLTPADIDRRGRFMDYGVDSILGIRLVGRLGRALGVELRPSVVFEFPTVSDLAMHLALDLAAEERVAPPAAAVQAERAAAAPDDADRRIAVIGMSGRFADVDDLDAFHDMLLRGRCGVGEVPAGRWATDVEGLPAQARGAAKFLVRGGFLRDIAGFDPLFFGMSGKEAELTDPQHRVFLMEAWRAVEDAGYSDRALDGARCGVFVGAHGGDYTHKMTEVGAAPDAYGFMGNAASILAARIAYVMNLKGPSIAVDSACSSSLVAIHLACQSLLAGECDLALAGGVFITTTVGFNVAAAKAGMLSPTGLCRAFDADADGFVPGEGAGVVVLKRLAQAVADGDAIVGVILGSGVNQDGKTNGITAPNPASQAALVREVHARAGVSGDDVSYVEAHGTGTRLGDPIEIEGLTRAFQASGARVGHCAVGSVKTNIGHCAHAAGVAGVLKVLLALRHRVLFPSLHFRRENPELRLAGSPFFIPTQARPWEQSPRIGAVSSFGFSGTNAHVVLAEAPPRQAPAVQAPAPHLVVVSARTPEALRARLEQLRRWLRTHSPALVDLGFTLGAGRSHFTWRWAAVISALDELHVALDAALAASAGVASPRRPSDGVQERAQALAAELAAPGAAARRRTAVVELADLYLGGGELDWDVIAAGGRRISLPGYPFARDPYWLTAASPIDGATTSAVAAATASRGEPGPVVTCFEPGWRSVERPDAARPELADGALWVFDRDVGRARAIAAKLGRPVVVVEIGTADQRVAADWFRVDPGQAAGYAALFAALAPPCAVVHLWDAGADDERLATGVQSLYFVLKGLAATRPQRRLPVIYVHGGADGAARPSQSAAAGFIRPLALVEPQLTLKTVEVDPPRLAEPALTALVLAELAAGPGEVRYAAGGRSSRDFLPVWTVGAAPEASPAAWSRERGVYVITGGLGGLGRLFARHLAAGPRVRVALVGRSPMDAARQAALAELATPGAEFSYWCGDVSDPADVGRIVAGVRARYGAIHGVIHAAGGPARSVLTSGDWPEFAAVLAPKLRGAQLLDAALADDDLDFFAVFSSLAGALGDFGQCSYAVASCYLGHFAAARASLRDRGLRRGRSVAIHWPMWREVSPHLSVAALELHARVSGLGLLDTSAGLATWDRALAAGRSQILVFANDESTAAQALSGGKAREATGEGASRSAGPAGPPAGSAGAPAVARLAQPAGPAGPPAGSAGAPAVARLAQPAAANASVEVAAVEAELLSRVARLLKLDRRRLEREASLSEFGFDSISLKTFAVELSQVYGVELSPAVFFAHSTVAALAAYMAAEHAPQVRAVHAGASRPAPSASGVRAPDAAVQTVAATRTTRATDRDVDGPVAVIGIAGVFPGSPDLDAFWEHLAGEHDLITEVPRSRWDQGASADDPAAADTPRWGGFIADVDKFDAAFFRISPREAQCMDPQHRLALEVTWKCVEDAGYRASALAGRRVGVFFGQQVNEYAAMLVDRDEARAQIALGSVAAMLPNRISHLLDLRGPSEAIDTACSSALVAVNRAVRAIRSGECEQALVGGVSLLLSRESFLTTAKLGILSPDGRCHTFDARANGYVRGEGVGVVMLKPLAQALADGDAVRAVILGTAVNHGGRAQSLTAPNPRAQSELVRAALAAADVDAATISYVEAHGTGTELGDPVEVEALKAAFSGAAVGARCGLGTVKTNIGHLEPAAGIAGLLKVVLALQHRTLPASLHFARQNPLIKFESSPFYVVDTTRPWSVAAGPRRAGVSSFGFGGTNAHVIVEEPPPRPAAAPSRPQLVVLSARTDEQLAARLAALIEFLARRGAVPLDDLAFTLQAGREPMAARLAVLCDPRDDLPARLEAARAALAGDAREGVWFGHSVGARSAAVSLVETAAGQALVAELVRTGDYGPLAALWVDGAAIDWTSLWPAGCGRRVALPTYPFARTRHWFDAAPQPPPTRLDAAPRSTPERVDAPAGGPAADPSTDPRRVVLDARVDGSTRAADPSTDPRRVVLDARVDGSTRAADPSTDPRRVVLDARVDGSTRAADLPRAPGAGRVAATLDRATVRARITSLLAAALYLEESAIDPRLGFAEMGLDSILAVELAKRINVELHTDLEAARLYDYSSIDALSDYLSAPQIDAPADPTHPHAVVVTRKGPAPAELADRLRAMLGEALYLDPRAIDDQTGFTELGLDSILAVELARKISASFGVALPATRLYDHASVHALAAHLCQELTPQPGASAEPAEDDPALVRVQEVLLAGLAEALHCAPGAISRTGKLDALPLSAEAGGRLLERLQREFGCTLRPADIPQANSVTALARLILRRTAGAPVPGPSAPSTATRAPVAPPVVVARPHATGADEVLRRLAQLLAALLGVEAAEIEREAPVAELGVDLVLATEWAAQINAEYGTRFAARHLFEAPTLRALACTVAGAAAPAGPQPSDPRSAAPQPGDPRSAAPQPEDPKPVGPSGRADTPCAVAIIGMAGRFPGADDLDQFWRNLVDGVDSVGELPPARARLSGAEGDVRRGGFLADIDSFDPLFFNISPREAELMDPQQRLFLEQAFLAVEDAGYGAQRLSGRDVGVYIGVGQGDYGQLLPRNAEALRGQMLLGSACSILTARIAYFLNLKGAAVAIDTACSSSLVAAHIACKSLQDGECDLALAGGVSLAVTAQMHAMTTASGMLASDGRSKTFDDTADGFGFGEGVGVVVLRRLDRALADGDRILAVIRGSGINQDGKTSGITAPSGLSQAALQARVYERHGIDPGQLSYVEAHGTGTKLGDPIEVNALTDAFRRSTDRRQFCAIGSVKTNIGHALAAAGVASLIKVVLSLRHRHLPPSLHFRSPNQHIRFSETPFTVVDAGRPWTVPIGQPRMAAISSFGFSGTNAHMVVQEAPAPVAAAAPRGAVVIALSARSNAALRRRLVQLRGWLATHQPALGDLAFTLGARRGHFEHRLITIAADLGDLDSKLAALGEGRRVDDAWITTDPLRSTYDDPRAARAVEAALRAAAPDDLRAALQALSRLYVEGVEIPWDALYPSGALLPAPRYPFERGRYWLGPETSTVAADQETRVERRIGAGDPIVADHRVHGRPMLPGVAYLELVRAAAAAGARGRTIHLRDVTWLRPQVVAEEVQIVVHLRPRPDGHEFTVVAADAPDAVLAAGRVVFEAARQVSPRRLDVAGLRAGAGPRIDRVAIDARFRRLGITYGPLFQGLHAVWPVPGGTLGEIAAIERAADPTIGLLDAALQAAIGLQVPDEPGDVAAAGGRSDARALVPSSVGEVRWFDTLTAPCVSHVRPDLARCRPGVFVCDVTIAAADGRPLACLRELVARELPARPVAPTVDHPGDRPAAAARPAPTAADAVLLNLRPRWRLTPLTGRRSEVGRVVIVAGPAASSWSTRLADSYGPRPTTIVALAATPSAAPQALASELSGLGAIGELVFCAWDEGGALDLERLARAEASGVFSLLAAIQAIDIPHLKVVTRGRQRVCDGDPVDPAFAATVGLARTLAREQPRTRVSIVDLPHAGTAVEDETWRWLAQEPGDVGAEVAYREGARHVLGFESAALPDRAPALRERGVYLIVGGAGGLGGAVGRWLAARSQARVALVGRRPPGTQQREAVAAIAAAGGQARYFAADAADPQAIAAVVAEVVADWGPVHGVIHSALELRDRTLQNLTAADLAAALRPKSIASVAVMQALAGHRLDLVAFFSSANAFTCNPGQGSYAAASTFADGFAEHLRARGEPVTVLNWGLWGGIGAVADDAVQQRAARHGVVPIDAAEGLQVFAQAVASRSPQVMVLKFTRAEAERTLARLEGAFAASSAPEAHDAALVVPAIAAEELAEATRQGELLTRHGRQRLAARLRDPWVTGHPGGDEPVDALLARVGVVAGYRRLGAALLAILGRAGLVRTDGSSWSPTEAWTDVCPDAAPSHPGLAGPVALLDACLAGLTDVLAGRRDAAEVLFPGGSTRLVEGVYAGAEASRRFNDAIAGVVAGLLRPAGSGPTRILEVGAGTGSATAPILERVRPDADRLEYTYTDVSPHFVQQGQRRFSGRPGLAFRVFDVERDPAGQGLLADSYDLVVAVNVVHATRDLRATLGRIKRLLRRGGALVLGEVTDASEFATLTFGLTPGWWLFTDPERRIPDAPLADLAGWRVLLAEQGFSAVRWAALGAAGSGQHHVIVGVSDGSPAAADDVPRAAASPAGDRPARSPAVAASALVEALAYVRGVFGEELKIAPQDLDARVGFARYGVDSVVMMAIAAAMERDLGPLPRTLLFDHATLEQLAEALVAQHHEGLRAHLAGLGGSAPARPEEAVAAEPAAVAPVQVPDARPPAAPAHGPARAPIAVIGVSGRYPRAEDLHEFWANLAAGRECIREVPPDRWRVEDLYDATGRDPRRSVSRWGGFIDDVDKFDPAFFHISPQEAAAIDPQERMVLQQVWAALEDAGYTRARLAARCGRGGRARVGVYIGAMNHDYLRLGAEDWARGNPGAASSSGWSLANRVSHFFDLHGPSMAVDTACSASLTAVHLACESLARGECDAAIVAGVNVILHPHGQVGLSRMGMLSPTGRSQAFAADGDGLVEGEGVGVLVLRRQGDAVADRDAIWGVLEGSSIGAGGRTSGYLMPSPAAQAELISDCLVRAAVDARSISYVEAQAVGSPVGDVIEFAGLARAFRRFTPDLGFCALGSIKPNIGHLTAASGVAQLSKVLLQLRHRRLAPTLVRGKIHPDIDLAASPFRIQTAEAAWERPLDPATGVALPLRAGVSSFGAGGANAHVIVAEYRPPPEPAAPAGRRLVFPLSAQDDARLAEAVARLRRHLDGPGVDQELGAISYTLAVGREAMPARMAVVASSHAELRAALDGFGAGPRRRGPAVAEPGVAALVAAGELERLAGSWADGAEVDWELLWSGPRPRPVSLPSYPFARRRCWLTDSSPPVTTGRTTFRAVIVRGPGTLDDLEFCDLPVTAPGPEAIQIAVRAFALNFADGLCVQGNYPNLPAYPFVPGFEVAGVVTAVGAGVHQFAPGDAVIALTGGVGGHAELVHVPAAAAVHKPDGVSFEAACAFPVAFLTVQHAFDRAAVGPGERVLIQTAAGGTGLVAVQLARARGAEVFATAGSAAKLEYLRGMGVEHVVNYREQDFAAAVRAQSGGRGVDVVLNTLGGDAVQKGLDLLGPGGRYVELAAAGLQALRGLDLSRFVDNQSFMSINLGRVLARPDQTREALAHMARVLAAGDIRPTVGKVFRFSELVQAYRWLGEGRNIGKVVVSLADGERPPVSVRVPGAGPARSWPREGVTGEAVARELRDIVAETLKWTAAELDPSRDLRDYGLNSVAGVTIMRQVQARSGLAIPVTALWQYPTLRGLGEFLARAHAEDAARTQVAPGDPGAPPIASGGRLAAVHDDDPLVAIHPGGSLPPTFWVHGLPGEVSWVVQLSRALGPTFPVHAFEARGFHGSSEPLRSIPAMAAHYVAAMRRRFPRGPYCLGGYSLGGAIALEMAQQLAQAGEHTSHVVLLDCVAPGTAALRGLARGLGDGFLFLLASNWFGALWGARAPLDRDAFFACTTREAQLALAVHHLTTQVQAPVGAADLRDYLDKLDRIGRINGDALAAYQAAPLPGATRGVLIRCTEGMVGHANRFGLPAFAADGDYRDGWDALFQDPLIVRDVACDHFELAAAPNIDRVAAHLHEVLRAVPPARSSVMTREHLLAVVRAQVERVLPELNPEEIRLDRSLRDLGANSIDRAEVATYCMEALQIVVSPAALAGVQDLKDLVDVLHAHLPPA